MSSLALEGAGPGRPPDLLAQLPVMLEELRRRPVMLAAVFAAIALLALAVGLVIPKKFVSSTTILVEESNIIAPLMEGRAVTTELADRAGITREVAFSRKVMGEVLKTGGWMADNPSPIQQDKLIEAITARTTISNPQPNLIQIGYADPDPERAFAVTKRFAEMVMSESLAAKERESRDAYQFIDSQVAQYHDKLTGAEANLERYRSTNADARPGIDADVNARIGELRRQAETAKVDLIDLRSEEAALQSQLSGESEINLVNSRASQIRGRLAELGAQRDQLLLTFTDKYPDVVRVQHQIEDLNEELRSETDRERRRVGASVTAINASSEYNPLYGELKSKLAEAQRRSAAMGSRMAESQSMLGEELARSSRIASSESSLAELTRDYEVNRDLYQDLLKRRENARVSMNLDAERRGLSFRIQEPATLPLRPSGIRLLYVAAAGLALAAAMPLVLLFGLAKFDPRVRLPARIEYEAQLPVLGSVPRYMTRALRTQRNRRYALAAITFLSVPLIYSALLLVRWTHAA